MAYTKHGHHVPGTGYGDAPTIAENCGGVKKCPHCSSESRFPTNRGEDQ